MTEEAAAAVAEVAVGVVEALQKAAEYAAEQTLAVQHVNHSVEVAEVVEEEEAVVTALTRAKRSFLEVEVAMASLNDALTKMAVSAVVAGMD